MAIRFSQVCAEKDARISALTKEIDALREELAGLKILQGFGQAHLIVNDLNQARALGARDTVAAVRECLAGTYAQNGTPGADAFDDAISMTKRWLKAYEEGLL